MRASRSQREHLPGARILDVDVLHGDAAPRGLRRGEPAASPSSISVGSIRTEPNATCDAERQTGTSRFVQSSRRGTSERYGIGYGGTATER